MRQNLRRRKTIRRGSLPLLQAIVGEGAEKPDRRVFQIGYARFTEPMAVEEPVGLAVLVGQLVGIDCDQT